MAESRSLPLSTEGSARRVEEGRFFRPIRPSKSDDAPIRIPNPLRDSEEEAVTTAEGTREF